MITNRRRKHFFLNGRTTALVVWVLAVWLGFDFPATGQLPQPVTLVDVLVLYTPQARVGAGGTAAIQASIDLAFFEANTVFQNSLVNARLRLAHASEVAYPESGSAATDLANLQNSNSPLSGMAAQLRDQYSADLVCLVTEQGNDWEFYGLQGPSAESAFSLLRRPFLTGSYFLPVVLGLNFGCQLERPYADSEGAFSYAYGCSFWVSNTLYSTVEGFSGQRLPFFSNPNVHYQGVSAGIPDGLPEPADNAQVLNHTAPLVAGFRGPIQTTFPPQVQLVLSGVANNQSSLPQGTNLTLRAVVSDLFGSVQQVNFYSEEANSGVVRLLGSVTNAPFQFFWTNLPHGSWKLIAQAVDDAGASTRTELGWIIQVIPPIPANDTFATATLLTNGHNLVTGTTFGATLENGEPDWNGGGGSVWYAWTAPAHGRIGLGMLVANSGTYFGAFTGADLTNLTAAGAAAVPWAGSLARFYLEVQAGMTYHVVVAGAGGPVGPFTLDLDFFPKPPNDDFENRSSIPAWGGISEVDNSFASFQSGEPSDLSPIIVGYAPGLHTVWWTWTAPVDGQVTIQPVCDFLHALGVFQGLTLASLTNVARSFNAGAILDVAAGTTFQISLDGISGQLGVVDLNLAFTPRPTNDNFTNSVMAVGAQTTLTGNNTGATYEPGEPAHDGIGSGRSVWWQWVAPVSGYVTLSPATNSGTPVVAVYTGNYLSNLSVVTASANGRVAFEVVRGSPYHFAVDGANNWQGAFSLNLLLSTIRLTTPAPGAVYFAGDSIAIAASTSGWDGDGTVVNFLNGTQLLGSSPVGAASLTWSNVALGTYSLTATITDAQGITRGSEPLTIHVRPANDSFANSFVLQGLNAVTNGTNLGASKESGEPTGGSASADASVWYSWTAPASGGVVVSIQENSFQGHPVGVYFGNSVTNLVALGESIYNFYPINFVAHQGVTYRIEVSGFSQSPPDGAGPFTLTLNQTPAPANDDFADRVTLSGSSVWFTGSNLTATHEPDEPGSGPTVWWSWTSPGTGSLYLRGNADTLGPIITVFSGSSLTNLAYAGAAIPSWYDGRDCYGEIHVLAGVTYALVMGGSYVHPVGTATIDLEFVNSPSNDDFANRYQLTGPMAVGLSSNVTATVESGETNSLGRSVWWSWRATNSGPVIIGSRGSSFSPWFSVFTGNTISNLSLITGGLAQVTFNAVAGTDYQISGNANGGGQAGDIELTLVAGPPANDNFANRISLSGTNLTTVASTVGATEERLELVHGGFAGSNSIWWTWTAPSTGTLTVTATGDGFGPTWSVYSGTGLSTLSLLADSYWHGNVRSSGMISVQQGTAYQIAVDGSPQVGGPAMGIVTLNLSFAGLPPNDNFANRIPITAAMGMVTGTTEGATKEPGEPDHAGYSGGHSIWYSFTSPVMGSLQLDTFGSSTTTLLGVYTGHSLTALTNVAAGNSSYAPVEFSCLAGETYQIALDHWYSDMSGSVVLNLNFSTLALTAPADGGVFHGSASIPLTAQLTSLDGPFTELDFMVDGVVIGAVTNDTRNFVWLNPSLGDHSLQVRLVNTNTVTKTSPGIGIHVRPLNDDFTNALVVQGVSVLRPGSTAGATLEPGEPLSQIGVPYHTVWYSWTAPESRLYDVVVHTPSAWLYLVEVYTGTELTNLTQVGTYQSYNQLTLNATAGTTYKVAVLNNNDYVLQIAPPPGNDYFSNAFALSGFHPDTNGDNSLATSEPGEPAHGNTPAAQSVWYSWTAPASGLVNITAQGTNFTPMISVFTGTTISNLANVTTGQGGGSFTSVAGVAYKVAVDGSGGAFGLSLRLTPPPANDAFASRQVLTGMRPLVQGSTYLSTSEVDEPGFLPFITSSSVWFSWVAPADGVARVFAGPKPIGVFVGDSVSNLTAVIAPDIGHLTFPAKAGVEYEIAIAGANWLPEDFTLSIVLPKAQFLTPTNGSAFALPASFEIVARTINLEGAVVAVGFFDGANLLGTVTNAPFQFLYTNVLAGSHLLSLTAIDEFGLGTTNVPIEVRVEPYNDNFAQRYILSGSSTNFVADISGATTEPGETLPDWATGRTLWWTWQAPASGTLTIDTEVFSAARPLPPLGVIFTWVPDDFGPHTGPLVAVYTNNSLTNLSLYASNSVPYDFTWSGEPDGWDVLPSFSFPVTAAQTYQISLDGVNGSFGTARVSFDLALPPAPPVNDNFSGRTPLVGSTVAATSTTVAATREPGEPLDITIPASRTVWFSWTALSAGDTSITEINGFGTFGGFLETLDIGVYTGSQLSHLRRVVSGTGSVSFYAVEGTTYQIDLASPDGSETDFQLTLVGPPPPPSINAGACKLLTNGSFQLSLSGVRGQSFVVESSLDLIHWEVLKIDTFAGTSFNFQDLTDPTLPRRFYRVFSLDDFF